MTTTFNNRDQAVAHMVNGGVISYAGLGRRVFRRINGKMHEVSTDHGKTWSPLSAIHLSDQPGVYTAEKTHDFVVNLGEPATVGPVVASTHMMNGGIVTIVGTGVDYRLSGGRLMRRVKKDGAWEPSAHGHLNLFAQYTLEPISAELSPTPPYNANGPTYYDALEHLNKGGVLTFCGSALERRIHEGKHQVRTSVFGVWTRWSDSTPEAMDKTRGAYVLQPIAKTPTVDLLPAECRAVIEDLRRCDKSAGGAHALKMFDKHFPKPAPKLPLYITDAVASLKSAGRVAESELLRMSAIKAGL